MVWYSRVHCLVVCVVWCSMVGCVLWGMWCAGCCVVGCVLLCYVVVCGM